MEREVFEDLVGQAIDSLPEEFAEALDNVSIVVQNWPSRRQMSTMRLRSRWALLGLYEGVPQTGRGENYNMVLPDKITLFQKPIEAQCRTPERIRRAVQDTVRHEIAHHFGISDTRLRQLEREKHKKSE